MTKDDPLANTNVRMLIHALAHGPQTWDELAESGLDRTAVLAAIDVATLAGLAAFHIGPVVVDRVDMEAQS